MKENEADKLTNIQVRITTRELLKKAGTKGETYDKIILRLLGKIPDQRSSQMSGKGFDHSTAWRRDDLDVEID
jgi:hypothetical protein